MPSAAPASVGPVYAETREVERALERAVFARPAVGREDHGVELEASIAARDAAEPLEETAVLPEAQRQLTRTLGHAVEERFGLDVAAARVERAGLGPVDAHARRHSSSLEFAQRLQSGQDRDVVLGRRSPEEHRASHRSPRLDAIKTSRVVVGQVVQEQDAVARDERRRAPT